MRTQQWHRLLGIVSALFVILLATTGILLNHTDALALHKRHIESPSLLSWYGFHLPDKSTSFQCDKIVVSQLNEQLYFNDKAIFVNPEKIIGSVYFGSMIVIADQYTLHLYTPKGELIENIEIPKQPTYIGLSHNNQNLIVATRNGNFQTDTSLLQWQKTDRSAEWANTIKIPQTLEQQLNRAYLGLGVSAERLLLDLHSGRFFGQYGVWFMDIVALAFCFLAMSGIFLWSQAEFRKAKRKKNGQKKA